MNTSFTPTTPRELSRSQRGLSWLGQGIAAAVLAQTLFFKFSGAAESRFIFETLGVEPWGRIGSGVVELVAVLLLLSGKQAALGALLATGTILGAIGAHLTKLGIEVQGDGGLLFALALLTLVASSLVLWIRREELPCRGTIFRRARASV